MRLLDALLPCTCMLCRQPARRSIDLCLACERACERNAPACALCAEALGADAADAICAGCIAAPPPWQRAVAPFAYSLPLARVIVALKSGNGLRQARILATLMAPIVRDAYRASGAQLPQALVPMPLTRRRLLRRGFNQAELLAAQLSRRLGIRCRRRDLRRVRHAPPQRTLPRSARLRNVRGAFALRRRAALPRCVALVDDVTTTGATLRAASEALLDGGVDEVHVWVAAKTRR